MIIISCEFVAQQNSFALVPEYCLTNIYKGINSFISACYSRILIQLNQNAMQFMRLQVYLQNINAEVHL